MFDSYVYFDGEHPNRRLNALENASTVSYLYLFEISVTDSE